MVLKEAPSQTEILEEVGRIAASEVFKGAEVLRNLLAYLAKRTVERPDAPVKGREIAAAVFGRSENFDSQGDSIVRVHTARLRSRLAEYYVGEGVNNPVRISVPRGGYLLSCQPVAPAVPVNGIVPTESRPEPEAGSVVVRQPVEALPRPARKWVIPLTLVLATAAITFTVTRWAGTASQSRDLPPALATFWSRFAAPGTKTLLVFSNLELTGSLEDGLQEFQNSRDQGKPVINTYTTVGEVAGVAAVTRILDRLGGAPVAKHGALLTWDEARESNLVFIGGPLASTPLRDITVLRDFEFRKPPSVVPARGEIVNLHPAAGEPVLFAGPVSRPFQEDYAVIALREPLKSSRSVLVMAGITEHGTQAASEFLSQQDTVNALLSRLKVSKGTHVPPFEAVIHTRIVSGVPVRSELVVVHAGR